MKDNYYLYVKGKRVGVSVEVWKYHNHNVNHIHYEANRDRRCKQCWANRRLRAACDGDCYTCRYYTPKGVSVDALTEHNSRMVTDTHTGLSYQCIELLCDLASIDPDGERIGRMIMARYTQAEIAAALHIPVSTYRDRWARIVRIMRGE